MNHPYSGAAGYIYANEYPYTPVDARHNDPYSKMQSFMPIQSVDSLPLSHPYSPENTIWSTGTSTQTQSQFSEDDQFRRTRRDSQRRLLPLRVPVTHPYGRQLDSWVDDDSVVEPQTPAHAFPPAAAIPTATTKPKRSATTKGEKTKGEAPVRRAAFVPYEPRAFEERERERRSAAWRRKIQKRVKRALRRLRRFLEAL